METREKNPVGGYRPEEIHLCMKYGWGKKGEKKEEEMDGGPTINDKIRKEKNMRDKICKIFLKPQTN